MFTSTFNISLLAARDVSVTFIIIGIFIYLFRALNSVRGCFTTTENVQKFFIFASYMRPQNIYKQNNSIPPICYML